MELHFEENQVFQMGQACEEDLQKDCGEKLQMKRG